MWTATFLLTYVALLACSLTVTAITGVPLLSLGVLGCFVVASYTTASAICD